jgi:hypothetical protein
MKIYESDGHHSICDGEYRNSSKHAKRKTSKFVAHLNRESKLEVMGSFCHEK